jgi:hypothetical protein
MTPDGIDRDDDADGPPTGCPDGDRDRAVVPPWYQVILDYWKPGPGPFDPADPAYPGPHDRDEGPPAEPPEWFDHDAGVWRPGPGPWAEPAGDDPLLERFRRVSGPLADDAR